MNRIAATLTDLQTDPGVCLISASAHGHAFFAMLVGDAPPLQTGAAITLKFKETEVAVARNLHGEISLRNRVPGVIASIEPGRLLSRVAIPFGDQTIHAVVTTGSVERLGLQAGVAIEWLVKANEMGVAC
ncbi:hypothetical protein JCM19000A_42180 [Silvimonas sp. JCM 19000]